MIPGQQYTVDDVLSALKRRKWLIIVPFVVFGVSTFAYTRKLPNLYRSETLILVVPQRVSESYVRSVVTSRIEDRLRSISEQLNSRARLEPIIHEFNLYWDERQKMPMEEVVAVMRRHIDVERVKDDSFRVTYISGDPRLARDVTARLAKVFIDENSRDREALAASTNDFLEAELDLARTRLKEHEEKLAAYRKAHMGELPSQLQSNLQVVQSTQQQLQAVNESINRDRDRRLGIERTLNDLETGSPTVIAENPAEPGSLDPLERAKADLASMLTRLKPGHPDVVAQTRRIKELEDTEATAPAPVAANGTASPASSAAARRMWSLRQELEQIDRQIATKEADAARLQRNILEYQRRVAAVPTRESDMTALMRDYDTLEKSYQLLLANKQASTISTNLERKQVGEQFKELDPAQLPERPFSPKRLQLNALGAAAGLLLGLAIGALLEFRDTTLRTEDHVTSILKLPLLATVPVLDSMRQRRVRKLRLLGSTAVLGLGVGAAALAAAWRLGYLERFL
jgi:polysaccharide chain length determinant protein (PEP-CTERM system associated)